jgi:hypothetical protein
MKQTSNAERPTSNAERPTPNVQCQKSDRPMDGFAVAKVNGRVVSCLWLRGLRDNRTTAQQMSAVGSQGPGTKFQKPASSPKNLELRICFGFRYSIFGFTLPGASRSLFQPRNSSGSSCVRTQTFQSLSVFNYAAAWRGRGVTFR